MSRRVGRWRRKAWLWQRKGRAEIERTGEAERTAFKTRGLHLLSKVRTVPGLRMKGV